MRGLQFSRDDRRVRLRSDLPEPQVQDPLEIVVEVLAAGVCGTDLHIMRGGLAEYLPQHVVLGHEVVGVVREMGSEVSGLELGQLVAMQPMGRCYVCRLCHLGRHNLCDENVTAHLGYGIDGGWGERCVLPSDRVYPIHPALAAAPEVAVLIEPMGLLANGFAKLGSHLRPGATVLILGGGLVGTLCAAALSFRGCRGVVVAEPSSERRRQLAGMRGVTAVPPEDLTRYAARVDVLIECCGVAEAVEAAMETLRDAAALLLLGIFDKGATARISLHDIMFGEISVFSALGNQHSFAEAAALVADMFEDGALSAEALGLKVFPIDRFEEAFADLQEKKITKAILTHKTE